MTATDSGGRKRIADLRRAQILDAANACFSREGFHGASMASIAAEAELSVGQIYRYFESKEAMIEALCEDFLEEWTETAASIHGQANDVVEELLAIARYNAEKLKQREGVSILLEFFAEAARNPRIGRLVERIDETIRAQVSEVLSRSEAGALAPEARVTLAMVLLFDALPLRVLKDPGVDVDQYLLSLRPMLESLTKA